MHKATGKTAQTARATPGFNLWKFYQGLFFNEKLCMSRDLYNNYRKQLMTLVEFPKIEPSNANQ